MLESEAHPDQKSEDTVEETLDCGGLAEGGRAGSIGHPTIVNYRPIGMFARKARLHYGLP